MIAIDMEMPESCRQCEFETHGRCAGRGRDGDLQEMERGAKKMSRYIYGMRLRGASPGAQPKEGLVEIQDSDGRYHSILAYERKLTSKERTDYELDYIGEYDEPERVWKI